MLAPEVEPCRCYDGVLPVSCPVHPSGPPVVGEHIVLGEE